MNQEVNKGSFILRAGTEIPKEEEAEILLSLDASRQL